MISHRRVCYRCFKPSVTCLCERIRRIANTTPVTILQHPRERFHPLGTVRIARLGLERVDVHVCHADAEIRSGPPSTLPSDAALIFPNDDAPELEAECRAGEPPSHLVFLDGTWSHAKTLYRDIPWVRGLRTSRLDPAAPGRYRIRREPRPEYLSTIEAIAAALAIVEPDTPNLAALGRAFDHLVDDQLEHVRRRAAGRRRRDRPPGPRLGVPRAAKNALERVIVVYGESAAAPVARARSRQPLQLTALRLRDGELFQRFIEPATMPSPRHLAHMGLTEERVASGRRAAEVVDEVQTFHPRDSIVVAWNRSVLDLARDLGFSGERLALRSIYCNRTGAACGTLEAVAASIGLDPIPLAVEGRAAKRLGLAGALAVWLWEGAWPLSQAS